MDEITRTIKDYYNTIFEKEWNRIVDRPEFLITCRFIDRYVNSRDKVLDIGGGPGRYSLYLSNRGCDVTLFDLSEKNINFASEKAKEQNLVLKTIVGDARTVDKDTNEIYDHILLMGPMYHILEENDRIKAVNAALSLLKPGGVIFISFINVIAGIIYSMKFNPALISDPLEREYYKFFTENQSFSGHTFTQSYFSKQDEILPFMEQFSLEKLHLIGQESISSPNEGDIMNQPKEIVDLWLDLFEQVCDREELLSWSEHLMYIGRKLI